MSSSESLTISSNRTLVSRGGVFELGFFKPSEHSRWYLGIWYPKITENTYAWVANRDNPLTNSTGTLEISGNNLVLLDQSNNTVWTTNLARANNNVRSPVMAELLPNGNFVLRQSDNSKDSGFLWQSFDFPTDTLLPGMKLGYDFKTKRNRFLTSWRAQDDPTSGDFTLKLDIQRGLSEFLIMYKESIWQRSGEWDGFSGIPEMQESYYIVYNYTENNEEVSYRFQMTNHSIYSRLIMRDWMLMQFTWIPPSWAWKPSVDSFLTKTCDVYAPCGGPNTYCDENTSPICNCITGYVPKKDTAWAERDEWLGLSSGCMRKELNCQGQHRFFQLNNTKLPDTKTATVDRRIDVKTCKDRCLSDCNCTSFAFGTEIGCVTWTGNLVDIRTYNEGGNVLYVKVSADDDADSSSGEKSDRTGKIIGLTIGGFSVMLTLIVIFFCFWKRRDKQAKADATPIVTNQVLMNEVVLPRKKRNLFGEEDEVKDLKLPLMEFEAVVAATQHFSDVNKVGKGGFGIVYKGRLSDGQEIAVKRLSEMSAQGTDEFMTEVTLIARLQHVNLVKLLGCCIYEGEKMLIYEYLENLSLDSHLFDEARSCLLNWQMRFDIISGIARGLLYLHQDSRFRIIHRDLKASNILFLYQNYNKEKPTRSYNYRSR